MPEDNEGRATKKPNLELPRVCGVFVGRDRETAEVMAFLEDQSPTACSIMLLYGPRGVGKSALACEVASRSYERGLFKTVLWFDRTRASELLLRNEGRFPLLVEREAALDHNSLSTSEAHKYMQQFTSKKDEDNSLPPRALDFLRRSLTNQPYLLVIDDFDEYENLGANDLGLCEELARINSPNKVILTTRLLEYSFSERVFQTLSLGLLSKEEVKDLALQCGIEALRSVQFVDGDLDDTVDYLWQASGGLPEFITRFFMPIAEQRAWLVGVDPGWQDAFRYFSAEYLGGREQSKLISEYEAKYHQNKESCTRKLAELSDREKCILISLALQEDTQACREEDLARSVGYRPEDELSAFDKRLKNLTEKRLIVARIEGEK